jgi:hypothetical protein
MDNYQAVYDAVRSKIGYLDMSVLSDRIVHCFDYSYQISAMLQSIEYEIVRPCVVMKPKVSIDGNQWCALYGDNLQDGVAGFGDSPAKAMLDFDKNWLQVLKEQENGNNQ